MSTDSVLDALEKALWARQRERDCHRAHNSDRGAQLIRFRSSGRLAEVGIEPTLGSTGHGYGGASAGTTPHETREG